jgi:nucleoside-diphosphate-sugar epimerase
MKIFLAGASGVVGRRLVPRLARDGHEVAGVTRRPARAEAIRAAGAQPVVCDVLDRDQVRRAVAALEPDIVVQHLTDLPTRLPPRKLAKAYEGNDRLREQGTANLVAAAEAAGAHRYVAQNVCFFYGLEGDRIKDESAPLLRDPPPPFDRSARVYREMEETILRAGFDGLLLRFGYWYGPGTAFSRDGFYAHEVRKRRFPIVGDGGGIFPFVHIDDVVEATVAAIEHGAPGIYNVADDDPAPTREWLPVFADAVGAEPPRRVPTWVARMFVGKLQARMATEMRGADNSKAKRELGWAPRFPSWRDGFRRALG